MKIIEKEFSLTIKTDRKGNIKPLSFFVDNVTYAIDNIKDVIRENKGGFITTIYICDFSSDEMQYSIGLKHHVNENTWQMYKL